MSDEVVSIVEFSEDIGEQEAPEPLPSGEYTATIQGAEVRESQRGTKYAQVAFHVAPEEFPADYPAENNPDGLLCYYRRVSLEDNPRSRYGTRKFCEAIGAPMSNRLDLNEWVGLTAIVNIDHSEYEGVTREEISRVTAG